MNREKRVEIARQTLEILSAGQYTNRHNELVDISVDLKHAIDNTELYQPNDYELDNTQIFKDNCIIEVTAETTFAAARRLAETENVCCLNFASARNPGGGFLNGAHSQEETLARASGLYKCQLKKMAMYEINRAHRSCLYTDHMIFSPKVPVFRDDNDQLLDKHYCVSIITAPAVNAGALKPDEIDYIPTVMFSRIEKLLALAVKQKQTTLILGAWGCGVFRNDPRQVAAWFAQHLQSHRFNKAFKRVVFAIYGKEETVNIFRSAL